MSKQRLLTCEVCGKPGARSRRITRTYGKGKDLLVVENVPAISCSRCGETYLTADTLHEIRRLRLHRKGLARQRSVDILSFA